ncbi:MAG: creatininase family protein [Gemmatimonadota bacterium]
MPGENLPLWQDLTTSDVTALAAGDPVVILPFAAVEQHGPHLPLSTDLVIAEGILEEAFRQLPADCLARVLPTQAVGASFEHQDLPGTLSLPAHLLEELVAGVGASLARDGVRRVLIFNSHGGNRGVVDSAALRLRRDHGLLIVKVYYPRFGLPTGVYLPPVELRHGLHGGAVETAMMLHLRPDLVRMEVARAFPSLGEELEAPGSGQAKGSDAAALLGPESAASFAWLAQDLNVSGVVGDPTLAHAAMGARLVTHFGEALARVIQETRAFPLERLRPGSGLRAGSHLRPGSTPRHEPGDEG